MSRPALRVVRESYRETPERDIAVSRHLLEQVSAGSEPETLRLYQPDASVAFGPQDLHAPGYPEAVRICREQGYAALERLVGGRAAVYHDQTLAFAWTLPDPAPIERITERFVALAERLTAAFRALGVDARLGEVPGEYCPGAYSVNARGRTKLMGVGQRLTRRAAHVGGVIVVGGSDRVREILSPVYEALDLAWDPETAGSLADEIGPVTLDAVTEAVLSEFGHDYDLYGGTLQHIDTG